MSICPFPPFEIRGNADLQGHLDTIYCKLIVSDGRGAEETRRGPNRGLLALTTKQIYLLWKVKATSYHQLQTKDKLDLSFWSSAQDLVDQISE